MTEFSIYQINTDRDDNRVCFLGLDTLERFQHSKAVDPALYDRVYDGKLDCNSLETIFENRFMHAREMVRMGASIRIEDRIALVSGGHPLGGTSVTSTDLRGGAALMLCGLLAEGETTLHDPNGQIARGYEDLPGMLRTLGASVEEE